MPVDKFGRFASGYRRESTNFARTIGYSLTHDGQIDVQGRQIKNIGEARDSEDAVSKNILDAVIESHQKFIENIFGRTMQYVESQHESTIQRVFNSQLEIKDLIVIQEGKIRNLINTRCDVIEKEQKQIKSNLQTEIAGIKKDLSILDQHVQALHPPPISAQVNPILWQDPAPKHKVTRKQNVRIAEEEGEANSSIVGTAYGEIIPEGNGQNASPIDPDYW